jgi:hypothetical protein
MAINLTAAYQVVLEKVTQGTVLTNTILVEKSEEVGRRGATVDVLVDYLEDLSVKTYTKANKTASDDYVYDQFSLTPIAVTLNDEIYAALEIDGWDNLEIGADNIAGFSPIINTLANRVKTYIENAVGVVINGLSGANVKNVTLTGSTRAEKGKEIITALQEASFDMNTNQVPADKRTAAVGRETYLNLLATDELMHADKSGEATPQALRAATIGTIAGFTVVSSDAIDDNAAVVFHKDAFGVVSRAPGKHNTAAYSELAVVDGAPINLRVNVDGLGARNASGIIVSTFFTVAEMVKSGATSNSRAKKLVFG